jgi:hypothetical protein
MKAFSGIGSRETPVEIGRLMKIVVAKLEFDGWTLRSGGAPGADTFCEDGIKNPKNKEIFLPWAGFNDREGIVCSKAQFEAAEKIACKFHPYWDNLKQGARKLHTRNVFQILGKNLDNPAKFVLCWTKDGGPTGGTGQAIRIAESRGIPIYNLFFNEVKEKLEKYLNSAVV